MVTFHLRYPETGNPSRKLEFLCKFSPIVFQAVPKFYAALNSFVWLDESISPIIYIWNSILWYCCKKSIKLLRLKHNLIFFRNSFVSGRLAFIFMFIQIFCFHKFPQYLFTIDLLKAFDTNKIMFNCLLKSGLTS